MTIEFERFTEKSRQALTLAQHEAERLNHPYIGPEHILLGLVQLGKGSGCEILQDLGVSLSSIKERLQLHLEPEKEAVQEQLRLTPSVKLVLQLAVDEARRYGYEYLGTEHLLAGLIRENKGVAYQVLNEMGVTLGKIRPQIERIAAENSAATRLPPLIASGRVLTNISPIFFLIILITGIAGYVTYQTDIDIKIATFVFVTGGWVISLCLHEFAHAIVGYFGGDSAVEAQGYLSLNPFKYTHPVLSIVLPMLYLALGGIGLPGGAVYINRHLITRKIMRSLVSAAGPIATAICAVTVLTPFAIINEAELLGHFEFWASLALLASLQLSALIFNVLPIPGLDGFGVIEPFLPDSFLQAIYGLRQYTLIIIFVLFYNRAFRDGFWAIVASITSLFNLDHRLVYQGFRLFQFWAS